MLLDMRDYLRQYAEAQTQYMLMTILGMSYCAIAKDPYTATIALWLMAPTFGLSAVERVVTLAVDEFALKDDYGFKAEDPLTSYIEPGAPGISALINRPFNENMPMVRLLGGKGGMTFSDPNKGFRNFLNIFIPEGVSTSVMNMVEQFDGDGSASAIYTNMVTGLALGVLGGIALQDVGTTLVPEWSSLADSTIAFNDPNADVRKYTYDAAMNANTKSVSEKVLRNLAEITGVVSGIIAADVALSAFPVLQIAAKSAIAVAGATLFGFDLAETGVSDLMDSHENAKARRMLDTLYSAKFSYSKVDGGNESGDVRLMEDFLYEKPFVNLGLFVSDSTLRAVEPGCYYEANKADKQQLCEIGLFGAGGKVAASNGMKNYSEFRKGDLKFKSGSDWSKMGVKIDRWEKVDGLNPDGSDNPKGVPIRHVERYEVPAITVEDYIEKYSFVVDDLMPHRLRQITMNFNFQTEVKWECDVKIDPKLDTACAVYADKNDGNGLQQIGKVPHPVDKNGDFTFIPANLPDSAFKNLSYFQKDNQNVVTISTVNKIGLTNTEENIKLVEKVLKALAYLFDTDDVKVDTSNFNPSRICKLYGTRAQKGADTAERPHRMSRIIGDVRPVLQTDRVYLEKIADMLPQVEQPQAYNNYSPATFDIESWMDEHGIRYTKKEWKDATRYVLDECPFNHDHHAPDSMILKQPSGAIGFRCLHNSCSGKTWRDVRIMYEPGAYDYAEKDAADSARINAGWKEHNKNRNDLHYEVVEVETDDNPIFENAVMIYAKPEEKNEFIETGITEIDNNIGGLEKTKVTVVSGLRAAAKSTLLSQIMLNAINAGETVLCYSGELTDRNFLSWMLRQAAGAEIEAFNTRHGANYIAPETKEKIVKWMGERFWLYNNDYGNDFDKIKQRLERGIREKKADLCVIDNLAILYLAAGNYDKYEAQTNFVKDLLSIAKRANCHIIFVAHPRKAEGFLRLDDIAGSGNLANLVDNALIVHRVNNDFKRLTAQMFKWKESNPIDEPTNVVGIHKARESGAQDVFVPLWYEDKTKRLKNYPGESFAYSWNADGFRPVEDDEVEF